MGLEKDPLVMGLEKRPLELKVPRLVPCSSGGSGSWVLQKDSVD